jgi:hypothetical protein
MMFAGFNSHLRLLHPDQLVCYAEHGSGRPNRAVAMLYYNCLLFHPHQATWLFCQFLYFFNLFSLQIFIYWLAYGSLHRILESSGCMACIMKIKLTLSNQQPANIY